MQASGSPLLGQCQPKSSACRSIAQQKGLHATAALRGNLGGSAIQPIQDLVTLKDVEVALVLQSPVREVDLVPEGEALLFEVEGDILHFVVPRLAGHQMVEVRYK
jgi:hypothetical protein